MGVNTSGLRRGNPVKQEEPLGLGSIRTISEVEERRILDEMKKEVFLSKLMQPGKNYAII